MIPIWHVKNVKTTGTQLLVALDYKWQDTDMNRHEGGPIFTTVDQKNKDNLLRTMDN